jgi:DNA-directed RNA polymerase specialized sigma24 family protein
MKEILSGRALLVHLNAADWKKILPRLHYYTLNKLQRYTILQDMFDVRGLSKQFADEAIRLAWEEQRKWNITYYPELYDFLKGVADSLISNFIKSKEVEITESLPDDDRTDFGEGSESPEDVLIRKETEMEMMRILEGDQKAAQVFDCLKDGLKPREIAEELDWDVQEVYNTIKRVQRKLSDYAKVK